MKFVPVALAVLAALAVPSHAEVSDDELESQVTFANHLVGDLFVCGAAHGRRYTREAVALEQVLRRSLLALGIDPSDERLQAQRIPVHKGGPEWSAPRKSVCRSYLHESANQQKTFKRLLGKN